MGQAAVADGESQQHAISELRPVSGVAREALVLHRGGPSANVPLWFFQQSTALDIVLIDRYSTNVDDIVIPLTPST